MNDNSNNQTPADPGTEEARRAPALPAVSPSGGWAPTNGCDTQ